MTQQIITYIILAMALGYLIYQFAWKPARKKKGDKDCDNCG